MGLFIANLSDELDVAVLIVITDKNLPIKPVKIAENSDHLQLGQRVYVISCALIQLPSLTTGYVAALLQNKILINMGVAGGASGAGVFNMKGELVGIIYSKYGYFLAVAIYSKDVREFMDSIGMEFIGEV
jgi:S1-C subfamily serine protease